MKKLECEDDLILENWRNFDEIFIVNVFRDGQMESVAGSWDRKNLDFFFACYLF